LEFFGITEIEATPSFSFVGKKQNYSSDSMIQIAWAKRAYQLAGVAHAEKFNKSLLPNLIQELKDRRQFVDSIREVPALLAKHGVRLVIVEAISGMKMTGACFWLDKSKPVIALTLTYDRVDNFWFTLFHEIDHVVHEEGQESPILDELPPETGDESVPPIEKRANEVASNSVIDQAELNGFIARVNPLFTADQIKGFAKRLSVHPGLVVGQLHIRKLIHYSVHRVMLEKVRAHIVGAALTDGFGSRLEI
jgi:HTH-type transcriptional regulator / antitoxin HigA